MAALTAAATGCAPARGPRRLDRRHRREPEDGGAAQRHSRGRGRAVAPTAARPRRRRIMTTDPFPKSAAVEVVTTAGTFRVGGMAKGSGMIEPRMATMLGYLTTDAAVDPGAAAARAGRGLPLHLQRHHGRRRAVDERLRVRAGQRRLRRHDRRRGGSGAVRGLPRGGPGAGARHRARRRGRHQARVDHGHRRRVATPTRGWPRAPSPTRCS